MGDDMESMSLCLYPHMNWDLIASVLYLKTLISIQFSIQFEIFHCHPLYIYVSIIQIFWSLTNSNMMHIQYLVIYSRYRHNAIGYVTTAHTSCPAAPVTLATTTGTTIPASYHKVKQLQCTDDRALRGRCARSPMSHSDPWPLLLTWFNFNPSMDK